VSAPGRLSVARRIVPPLAVFVLAIIAWDAYIQVTHIESYLLPRPSAVLKSLVHDRADLLASLGWTALTSTIGFVASALVGVLIAIALSASNVLRRALYPYTIFFQTVPIIAIAPMLLFWIGAGLESVAVCAFIVSVFPVIANTLTGLLSTDPALDDLFRLYGAGKLATLWKLRLPAALPSIFTGLRIAAGLSVIGAVVAELLVGTIVERVGLGVRIVSAIKVSRVDLAFASVLLASALGLALFATVNLAARLALQRWHASEQ
jgi:NitT/TauT family transport system permease protein